MSEISARQDINPKGSNSDGMFKEHIGADGTSIWAAATSSFSAVAVNMLASMLSELWSDSQATAIWSQLVSRRVREIQETCDGTEASHITQMEAAKQTISRKELAEWDASARAWRRRAFEAKRRERTQLDLILNNLDLAVDGSRDVYQSVIRAWNGAMTVMENLLNGVNQNVTNGSILLALSAWHLYPNMLIFGN